MCTLRQKYLRKKTILKELILVLFGICPQSAAVLARITGRSAKVHPSDASVSSADPHELVEDIHAVQKRRKEEKGEK